MVTTKFYIKEHLKEYMIGKFNNHADSPVYLPDDMDLYHTIYDLMQKRPIDCPLDKGNIEIVLPNRRCGKDPEYYNYISIRAQLIINRKIERMFWAELHEYIDDNRHMKGINLIDSVCTFMTKYRINSITIDALIKNYYRWRDKVRKRDTKRNYTKNNSPTKCS